VSGTGDALIRQGKIGSSVETVVTLRMSGEKASELASALAVGMSAIQNGPHDYKASYDLLQELLGALDTE